MELVPIAGGAPSAGVVEPAPAAGVVEPAPAAGVVEPAPAAAGRPSVRCRPLPGGGAVVDVAGEIDLSNCDLLADGLAEAAGHGTPTLLDMTACTFIDSSGLAKLFTAGTPGNEPWMAIVGARGHVSRVLRLTRVDSRIPMFPSLSEAQLAMRRA